MIKRGSTPRSRAWWRQLPLLSLLALVSGPIRAQGILGEEPALGSAESRITQAEIAGGSLTLLDIRLAGLKVFATQFRRADGFGDGPVNPADTTTPGGRPTLQDNGTFLRVNGLDGQACLDCHGLISADAVPAITGVGGAGGINNSPFFMPRSIDVADAAGNGFAAIDGRVINPPALFGTGAVQQLGKEMTADLQALRAEALRNPGRPVALETHGVSFGTLRADARGDLDTSRVEGVDADLVVRPFGRKGEFATVRAFDLEALAFHMGMQPVEVVGAGVDGDGDGVVDEIRAGEISALEVFITTQERPVTRPGGSEAERGARLFTHLGCAGCHRPVLVTRSPYLGYSLPEVPANPAANVFYTVDLRQPPAGLAPDEGGGVRVPLFSDLKRHDMGPGLAEDFFAVSETRNREFITAKLWGVADTAPYLHDGRALTLNEAILLHGGEAQAARDAYERLATRRKNQVIEFLRTLRNPRSPNADVLN